LSIIIFKKGKRKKEKGKRKKEKERHLISYSFKYIMLIKGKEDIFIEI
jgi:hypothetical protein